MRSLWFPDVFVRKPTNWTCQNRLENIHDVFHVFLLEPYHTIEGRASAPPPLSEDDREDQAEIEEILDSCMHYGKLQCFFKWVGYIVTDNEWVPADHLSSAE